MKHLDRQELDAGLESIRQAPADGGSLELIVRRPVEGEREEVPVAELSREAGLVGDNWKSRGSKEIPDGSAHPDRQVTVMSARAAALIAVDPDRRRLAGDQLFIDLDLSVDNLPAGAQVAIGSAVLEVTALPHNGCKKFATRFGQDAVRFVNSPEGKRLRLRGLNAKVIRAGTIRVGDVARKLSR